MRSQWFSSQPLQRCHARGRLRFRRFQSSQAGCEISLHTRPANQCEADRSDLGLVSPTLFQIYFFSSGSLPIRIECCKSIAGRMEPRVSPHYYIHQPVAPAQIWSVACAYAHGKSKHIPTRAYLPHHYEPCLWSQSARTKCRPERSQPASSERSRKPRAARAN